MARSPQTAAKRAREQAKREKRERKEAKKAARADSAADGASWLIVKSAAISPPSGDEFDAYVVKLVSGSATRDVIVEFATPSTTASVDAAEEATRAFLESEEPPLHIVVGTDGAVKARSEAPRAD